VSSIIINGVNVINQTKSGITLQSKIDLELDSGSIILPYTDNAVAYTPYTPVFVAFQGGGLNSYYIESDQVVTIGANPVKYQHSITLIEPTKILEKYVINDMTITQPLIAEFPEYSLLDVVYRIINNFPLRALGADGKIVDSVDSTLQSTLSAIKSPELSLRGMTMREALDRVLSYVNAISRLRIDFTTGQKILTADYYDTLLNLISTNNVLNTSKNRSGDSYAISGDMTVENATQEYSTINYPGDRWAGVRSIDPVVTDQNLLFILPYPIYEIEQFRIYCKVNEYSDDLFANYLGTYEKEVDITGFVIEKTLWDALPEPTTTLQREGKKHKMNTLYYTRGDNKIYNIGTTVRFYGFQFIYDRVIDTLLSLTVRYTNSNAIRVKWAAGTITGVGNQASFMDLLFNTKYRTIINTKVRAHRDSKEDFINTQTPLNQGDNVIELENLGTNARGTINKIGNEDITITNRVSSYSSVYRPGQFTTDGYIVTNTDSQIFNDYIMTTAFLTKNYNGLSKFVGVDQQVRQIPLPLQSITTKLYYEQFIIVSNTLTTPATSTQTNYLSASFVENMGRYLRTTAIWPSDGGRYKTKEEIFSTTTTQSDGNLNGGVTFTTADGIIVNTSLSGSLVGGTSGAVVRLYTVQDTGTSFTQWTVNGFSWIVSIPLLLPKTTYRLAIRRFADADNNANDFAQLTYRYTSKTLIDKYHGVFRSFSSTGAGTFFLGMRLDVSNFNNSFKFDFGFDSSKSAGQYTDFADLAGVPVLIRSLYNINYTDFYGRFNKFNFYIGQTTPENNYLNTAAAARIYPILALSDFSDLVVQSPEFDYTKDSLEEFNMTYQVHTVIDDANKDAIVLGRYFLSKMFAFSDFNDATFSIYASTSEYYNKNDTLKAKGTKLSGSNHYTVTTSTSSHPYRIAITPNVSLTSFTSWAIANQNGELILAVNRQNPRTQVNTNVSTVYLTFTDRR
jgi:hypothetical protein